MPTLFASLASYTSLIVPKGFDRGTGGPSPIELLENSSPMKVGAWTVSACWSADGGGVSRRKPFATRASYARRRPAKRGGGGPRKRTRGRRWRAAEDVSLGAATLVVWARSIARISLATVDSGAGSPGASAPAVMTQAGKPADPPRPIRDAARALTAARLTAGVAAGEATDGVAARTGTWGLRPPLPRRPLPPRPLPPRPRPPRPFRCFLAVGWAAPPTSAAATLLAPGLPGAARWLRRWHLLGSWSRLPHIWQAGRPSGSAFRFLAKSLLPAGARLKCGFRVVALLGAAAPAARARLQSLPPEWSFPQKRQRRAPALSRLPWRNEQLLP